MLESISTWTCETGDDIMLDFSFFDEDWSSTWNLCCNGTSKLECEYNIAVEEFRKKYQL